MRDENGSLKVEDVQYPDDAGQVTSMQTRLMLTVPLIELANAWRNGDLESVKQNSSMDFNRLVWSNLTEVPSRMNQLPDVLLMPVEKTETGEQRAVVKLAAPGKSPVTVLLLRENSTWVVDEISLSQAGGTQFDLRKSLRQEIAQQFLIDPTGGIRQAVYENSSLPASGVVRANGTAPEKPRGNLTLPSGSKTAVPRKAMSAGIEKPLTPATSGNSQSAQEVTLRFGPQTEPSNPMNSEDAGVPPRIRPQAAEQEEHDGIVYFKGAPETPPEAPMVDAPASKTAAITDLSQHPIEISLE